MWKDGFFRIQTSHPSFSTCQIDFKSLGRRRFLYESNFISGGLLVNAIKSSARRLRISEDNFNGKTMTALATGTIRKTKPLTKFQRTVKKDQTTVKGCVDTYEIFIQALAQKFSSSTEEAEAVTQEIFKDIWRYSKRANQPQSAENLLTALIARRRLITYLQ